MSATDWPALLPDVARRLLGEPDATESGGATWRYGNRGILGGARRWSLPDAVPTSAAEGRCAPTAEQWTCAPRLRADSAAAWCAVPCSAPPGAGERDGDPPRRGAVTGRRCWHDPRRPCARCRRAWRLRELLRLISSAERAAGQRLPLLPADFDSAFVRQGAPWTEPAQLDLFAPEPAPGALCGAETPPVAREHPHPPAPRTR